MQSGSLCVGASFRIQASAEAAEAVAALFRRWGGDVLVEHPLVQTGDADEYDTPAEALRTIRTYVSEDADWQRAEQEITRAIGILRAFDLAPLGTLDVRWDGRGKTGRLLGGSTITRSG